MCGGNYVYVYTSYLFCISGESSLIQDYRCRIQGMYISILSQIPPFHRFPFLPQMVGKSFPKQGTAVVSGDMTLRKIRYPCYYRAKVHILI